MQKTIIDASPLIFIAKAGLLDVLKRVYKKVYVTQWIWNEIEWPIKHGYKAPEVDAILKSKIICIEPLTAKEIDQAIKLSRNHKIGKGEAEACILFKRGNYTAVIVADIRARRILKDLEIGVLDLVDLGIVAAKKKIMNPREFAKTLYEKAHYTTQRIKDMLGR